MSRQPSWASFTRPLDNSNPPTFPSNMGNFQYKTYNPVVTNGGTAYPTTLPPQVISNANPVPAPNPDPDASIRNLLADILGGGDGGGNPGSPTQMAPQYQHPQQGVLYGQAPLTSHPLHYGSGYAVGQAGPVPPGPIVPPNPRPNQRQLITLSNPNTPPVSYSNNNVSNGSGYVENAKSDRTLPPTLLHPGVKRKPDDVVNPPFSSDEEYKKSTKHFLYHCDVCNFTCQGPGIYYHIVSPKHKNLCQKGVRAYVEPKGVLVGVSGPTKDGSSGKEYRRVGDAAAVPERSGADDVEFSDFYSFCRSLQIPPDLVPAPEFLASVRSRTAAEPEREDAQLAKLVSSIRASAAVVEEKTKTTSRNFRYWVSTFKEQQKEKEMKKVLPVKGAEPFRFKIVNYNVLAQAMMTEQSYNFTQHKPEHLQWEYRSKRIEDEIDYIGDPEIICLQEVASDVYASFFVPLLEMRGYLGMFRCRQSGVAEGCAIFVRLDKFRFIDAHPFSMKKDCPILDRDNVGLMVKVKPIVQRPKNVAPEKWKEPDIHLCIITTQLLFSAQRGDTKLAQLGLLFAEMDRFCRRPSSTNDVSYYPTIFCGDLNALPYSHLYRFVQAKRLKYAGLQADEISGQTNVFQKEKKVFLKKPLFPAEVGVDENCQYTETPPTEPLGELSHNFKFVTVYKHEIAARERDPNDEGEIEIKAVDNREISTQIKGFSTCTDYMFYTVDGFRVNHNLQTGRILPQDVLEGPMRIIARHRIPVMSEMSEIGLIPNSTDGSDHFPIAAEFLLNPWTYTR